MVYVLLKGHKMVEWHIVSSFPKSKHFQKLTCQGKGRWAFWELLSSSIRIFLPCFPSTRLNVPAVIPPGSMKQRCPKQLTFWLSPSVYRVHIFTIRNESALLKTVIYPGRKMKSN